MTLEEKKQCVIELRKAFEHICAADALCGAEAQRDIVRAKTYVIRALTQVHAEYTRSARETPEQ